MSELERLGWDDARHTELQGGETDTLCPARIAVASRGQCQLLGMGDPVWATFRRSLNGPRAAAADTPVVGDWVLARAEGESYVVERLLARRSVFVRKAVGKAARPHVVAANLDRVFIVTAVGHDFNLRRIERYLTAVWDSGAEPVIVVNKTDLNHDPDAMGTELDTVALGVRVALVSAAADDGLEEILALCPGGSTVALVGSSGVGKSTIVNRLLGEERQKTLAVRDADHKGRHTTTGQEMFVTPTGAVLIDTPGMREFGLWDAEGGIDRTFSDIVAWADSCRYRDCAHGGEPGCALDLAIARGDLSTARLQSYHRLQRELDHTARRADARTKENSKKRWKTISRTIRDYSKNDPKR